jgi:hypothetical protein
MIQPTEPRGKPNPDGLDLVICATCSRLSKPSVEQRAGLSKGEALRKELADLHLISIRKPPAFTDEKGFSVRKPLLFRL